MGDASRAQSVAAAERPLVIYGGVFDPVHNGHLWLATRAAAAFSATVRMIPNGEPPHRPPPVAPWQQRVEMCHLAVAGRRHLEVGEDEPPGDIRYSIDTLRRLRRRQPHRPLLLLVGADAFNHWRQWRQWEMIPKVAHIIIAARAGAAPPPAELQNYCRRLRCRKAELAQVTSGGMYFWRCQPPAVASRDIRAAFAAGQSHALPLPPAVRDYALQHHLYSAISASRPQ